MNGITYLSHLPNKLLEEHLLEVAQGARECLNHRALLNSELLQEASYLTGLCHDLGKYTTFFQRHLRGQRNPDSLSNHAFMSAVLGAYLAKGNLVAFETEEGQFLPLLVYLTIHRHHGNLRDLDSILPDTFSVFKKWPQDVSRVTGELRRPLESLKKQLEDLSANWEDIFPQLERLEIGRQIEQFLKNQPVVELFEELNRLYYLMNRLAREREDSGARLCVWGQLLFSALIDADKYSAAGVERVQRRHLAKQLVEDYVKEEFGQPRHDLDVQRAEFSATVRKKGEKYLPETENQFFTLTAPTGMGKTLAAFDFALRFRASRGELYGVQPRIIYALPFINIIEQNYDVCDQLLRKRIGGDYENSPEQYLLRHHHLAEVTYTVESEQRPLEDALLLTESWESEIVVTTFVQLFQTLIGFRNRFLKKFHNLIGSLIILDEVQSLPLEYWSLTQKVFETVCRELGITILLVTATRPLILPPERSRELSGGAEKRWLPFKNRTVLNIDLKERDTKDWVEWIWELYGRYDALLVVVNTVRASLEIYKLLRGENRLGAFAQQPPETDEWLVYMSTNITPGYRRQRLQALKKHLEGKRRCILVSTQVIEAGVDIDFPAVLRDLGPIDSVIQVAGRCNREGKRDFGPVFIGCLSNGGGGRVYGPVHQQVACQLLSEREVLPELEYGELISRYFELVRLRGSEQRSKDLWQAYCRLKYDSLEESALSDFDLLEGPQQVPVFVSMSPEDEQWLLEEFEPKVFDSELSIVERKYFYLKYRKRFHDLCIRPTVTRVESNMPPLLGRSKSVRWVPYAELDRFYDLEYGFKWLTEDKRPHIF